MEDHRKPSPRSKVRGNIGSHNTPRNRSSGVDLIACSTTLEHVNGLGYRCPLINNLAISTLSQLRHRNVGRQVWAR
jgi:hypothetical protein